MLNTFECVIELIIRNTRILKLSVGEDFVIACIILTQCQRESDGRTDGQSNRSKYRASYADAL